MTATVEFVAIDSTTLEAETRIEGRVYAVLTALEGLQRQLRTTRERLAGDDPDPRLAEDEDSTMCYLGLLIERLVEGLGPEHEATSSVALDTLQNALNGLGWAIRNAETEWLPPISPAV